MFPAVIVILLIAAALVVFLVFKSKKSEYPETLPKPKPEVVLDPTPDTPQSFGYKSTWISIKADDPQKVAEILKLQDIKPANWETGLESANVNYESQVFITPPVYGWIHIIGALPDFYWDHTKELLSLLEELGKTYDPVLFFATHRVSDYHAWARVDAGKVTRAFGFCDEIFCDHGEMTADELELNVDDILYDLDDEEEYEDGETEDRIEKNYVDEDTVIQMAESWAVNPTELEDADAAPGVGLVGTVPKEWG